MEEDVENKNSNVSYCWMSQFYLTYLLIDKVESFAPEDENDEIDDFLAMEVSSNFKEGYFDSEGDNDDSEDEDNSTFFPKNESSILEPSSPRSAAGTTICCLIFKLERQKK
ncbi:hypothetical protein Tco_1411181 [Tanacetum coccineum]